MSVLYRNQSLVGVSLTVSMNVCALYMVVVLSELLRCCAEMGKTWDCSFACGSGELPGRGGTSSAR